MSEKTEVNLNEEAEILWQKILGDISVKLTEAQYNGLISQLVPREIKEDTLVIACNNPFIKANAQKYKTILEDSAKFVGQKTYKIEINIEKGLEIKNTKTSVAKERKSEAPKAPAIDTHSLFENPKNPEDILKEKQKKSGLHPKFTFENYLMGDNNRLAYAIAEAVAEKPGEVYNPVFIYSGVGLGKTHLLQAIGNRILKKRPGTKVVYTTGETFTNELIEAIQNNKSRGGKYTSNEFRDKFRKADVFLIDDVQFIAGRPSTQEEFFHTFNALHMEQKQIVITSDRPPKDFDKIEDRITSRFNSGIIVDIQAPGFEMRAAILRRKREQNNDDIPDEVINFIAESVDSNVREMEGAYLQVLTYANAHKISLTKEIAANALGKTLKEKIAKNININDILKAVCTYYSVKSVDIKGSKRTKDLVVPRQVAMYLIKDITNMPLITIGEFLGGRDHTTIMHGIEKIETELRQLGKTTQDVSNVKQLIHQL